jgi:mannose-6-phosphate isomerase
MLPLILEPYARPQVWGGRRLPERYGKAAPADVSIGESWEISGHSLHLSRVQEGPFAGISLNELWIEHRDTWCPIPGLRALKCFPWLVKLLDCHEASSVQIHPTDAQAEAFRPGESGKTEAWYVLEAAPDSRFYTGLLPGVTESEVRHHIAAGTLTEVLHAVTPHVGDAYLIPAGLVHAIGTGLVLFEIEQSSDLTWRLFDWNRVDASGRPRELHIDRALSCLDWNCPPAMSTQQRRLAESTTNVRVERCLSCAWFAMDRIVIDANDWITPAEQLTAWFVVDGAARLDTGNGNWSRECAIGQTILAPPDHEPLRWTRTSHEPLTLLRCSWPDEVIS